MARFEDGVRAYVKGETTVAVYFPVDARGEADISCRQCPHYVQSQRRCGLNSRVVAYPDKFVGQDCPLELKEGCDNVQRNS